MLWTENNQLALALALIWLAFNSFELAWNSHRTYVMLTVQALFRHSSSQFSKTFFFVFYTSVSLNVVLLRKNP